MKTKTVIEGWGKKKDILGKKLLLSDWQHRAILSINRMLNPKFHKKERFSRYRITIEKL